MTNYLVNFNFNFIAPTTNIVDPCPDQVIGELSYGKFIPAQTRVDIDYQIALGRDIISNNLNSPVIVVLESPHKNEFDPITLKAIGPCMGTTGYNFKKYFDFCLTKSVLHNALNIKNHDVVIMNAVQYQCSLGRSLSGIGTYNNKRQRDLNFIKCLNNSDICRRINAINPFAVINLCTVGLKQNNLQQKVNSILLPMNIINYTTGWHPATWKKLKYRSIN